MSAGSQPILLLTPLARCQTSELCLTTAVLRRPCDMPCHAMTCAVSLAPAATMSPNSARIVLLSAKLKRSRWSAREQHRPCQMESCSSTHPSAPSAPAGLPLLPIPAGSHLRPNVTLILVQAAPSEITQLPVHAKRHLSLILGDGLTLFQKVLPCCAFGFCYLTW